MQDLQESDSRKSSLLQLIMKETWLNVERLLYMKNLWVTSMLLIYLLF